MNAQAISGAAVGAPLFCGGGFANGLSAQLTNGVNLDNVTGFIIRASGANGVDNTSFPGLGGNDDFTLSAVEVAPVPVPAAFGLPALALGGLGLAKRGRKVA